MGGEKNNPLIFSTGPFTGTKVPNSGRYAVVAMSPLSNIWREVDSGRWFGIDLKRADYDAVVITGKASGPVYLLITDEEQEICDATEIWGTDSYEASRVLTERYAEKNCRASVVTIGQAGENHVPLACILTEGLEARSAGRAGMGAKFLKAVITKGQKTVPIFDSDALLKSIRSVVPRILQIT